MKTDHKGSTLQGKKLKLTGKKIIDQAEQYKWSGEGTEEVPFQIANVKNSTLEISLKKSEYHLIFNNCIFKSLILNQCKNITINRCTLNHFEIKFCYNSVFQFNTIKHLRVLLSGNNQFRENFLTPKAYNYLNAKFWEREFFPRLIWVIFWLGITMILYLFGSQNLFVIIISSVILLGYLLHIFIYYKRDNNKLPQDILIKNSKKEFNYLEVILHQLL